MKTFTATIHHSGLTDEERELIREYANLRESAAQFPEGSTLRAEFDKRLATLEIKLGL